MEEDQVKCQRLPIYNPDESSEVWQKKFDKIRIEDDWEIITVGAAIYVKRDVTKKIQEVKIVSEKLGYILQIKNFQKYLKIKMKSIVLTRFSNIIEMSLGGYSI